MQNIAKTRIQVRNSRHRRIRRQITGTADRPRLAVRRSVGHIYAQLIDDETGKSLGQVSSLHKEIAGDKKSKLESSKLVGQKIGALAKEKGIEGVVFDRGGYLYHGRVKALADAAREAGLKF